MLHPAKSDEWTCPKCGSNDCEVYDTDYDANCLVRKMTCNHCDHDWREYFKVEYDGYTDDSGEYDADGLCVDPFIDDEKEDQ